MYNQHNPLLVEQDFKINRGGVEITGRIDLIESTGNVIDHKFSSEIWSDVRAKYGVQPIIYQWAIEDDISKKHDVEFNEFYYNIINTYPLQIQKIRYYRATNNNLIGGKTKFRILPMV